MEMNKKNQLITLLLGELQLSTTNNSSTNRTMSEDRLLLFTEKEIIKMPKHFRKIFRTQGCKAHVRKRTTGRYNCSYEIRYARKPYNTHPISASGTTLEEAKARFIEKLNNYIPQDDTTPTVPTDFDGFAIYWLDNFHKRKVCVETFKHSIVRYKKHVKPILGNRKLKDITALDIQRLLDSLIDRKRLEEDTYSMLNQIFACAVKFGLIRLNPVGMVFHQMGEREHGKRIEKDEEERLMSAYADTPFQIVFAVMMYTGLRPNEYATATIEGNFIKAINSKRKNGKIEYKKIPITPMLRPYLVGITELPKVNFKTLDRRYKAILPNHKLYDMRTTFQTRCSECGIPDNVIGVWMGNSIGKLKDTYTDFSDEYLLKEAEKLLY